MLSFPTTNPEPGSLFRHTDGGLYRFVALARHTDDTSPLYLYEHLWPFPPGPLWARPASQWASRFKAISEQDLLDAKLGDPLKAQAEIAAAKAARKARPSSTSASTPTKGDAL